MYQKVPPQKSEKTFSMKFVIREKGKSNKMRE